MTVESVLSFSLGSAVLFVFAYYPIASRFSVTLVSPYPKADIRKRLNAAAVDFMLVLSGAWLYLRLESLPWLVATSAYVLLRDAARGQSLGKFLFGLVVINLETGRPATLARSIRRNGMLLLPGANVAAVLLEVITLTRDPQGQRLGDRLAQTQVVEGLGARDLAEAFQRWWRGSVSDLPIGGRRRRNPAVVD